MEYAAKACTHKKYRRKNKIILSIMTALSVLSLIMLAFSFVSEKILFGLSWLIAFILLASYVLIRYNTVFPTYLATDKKNIYMNTWKNDFFSYDVSNKIKIIREFVPSKTKLIKIPIDKISSIVVGTKNSVKKYAEENEEFQKKVQPFENSKDFAQKKAVNSMDLFFVTTTEGTSYFMPIENFSPRDVSRVLQFIQRLNPEINIKVNSRTFRISLKEK